MSFFLIGIDHRYASIEQREQLFYQRQCIHEFWKQHLPGSVALLQTCNRTELYGRAHDLYEAEAVTELFRKTFDKYLNGAYAIFGRDAVLEHALRLLCGLESQIQGECQILKQIHDWRTHTRIPGYVNKLFEEALNTAVAIRAKSGLLHGTATIASVLLAAIREEKSAAAQAEDIFVIGTGHVAGLIARTFSRQRRVHFISKKNKNRARELAALTEGTVYARDELTDIISRAQTIIVATTSPHYIICMEHFSRSASDRKNPLFVYDVSMPSGVDPAVGAFNNIYVRNADALTSVIEQSNARYAPQLAIAERMITTYISQTQGVYL